MEHGQWWRSPFGAAEDRNAELAALATNPPAWQSLSGAAEDRNRAEIRPCGMEISSHFCLLFGRGSVAIGHRLVSELGLSTFSSALGQC
ncbi:hypothetical protein [Kitasatospora griseola]|uniref:hypothetical protein n=1 Tax=Kitasatospora griseola TaxID=2064 RepID=UPI003855D085